MDFPGHFEQIFQQLNHQRLHGQLCDCVITVGGRHFKAHRSVLSACSTHFRALFTADGDAGTGSVLLDSEVVTAEAFSALMDMMYTSTLMLGSSNVMDVLLAASHLHLNAVVKACKRYLTTRTLPLSPPAARGGSGTHFQRSVLLQQLGLSLVSSALSGAEDEGTRLHRRSGSTHPFLKRKLSPLVGTSPPGCGPLDDSEGGENLLLPDSHGKMVDEGGEYRAVLMHDDVQLPSQSDGDVGREPRKEEYADTMKSNPEEDERHVQVVVKSEPLPSPDHTSPTQVEPVGEKVELSPDGSDRSFFDPQHGSDLLIKAVSGAREEREGRSSDGLLCGKASSHLDNVPNTTTAEFQDSSRFFLPSSSSALQLLPPDGPDLQTESLFLRPAFEGMAAAHGGNMDQLALDFQRNILGLQTQFPRSPRGDAPAASYRRIAPKLPSGSGGEAQAASANPPPQLTRASADVLSKCKKALSEHNVLVVEGARKYACKICCKTFLTLTDCKKHIRVHTGERPYACLKCGKRFSQSSHLYKHSKTTCLRWQSPAGLL